MILKTLAKCVGEYKKETFLAPLFVALESILEVVVPFIMAGLINNLELFASEGYVNNGSETITIVKYAIILLCCALLAIYFGVRSGFVSAAASSGLAKNLRKRMYYNVQTFAFSNIDKFSTSSLISRMTTDVANVQMAFQMIMRTVVKAPIMIIMSLIFTFILSYKLALVYLCIIPILLGVLILIASKTHPVFERVFTTYDHLNNVVQENVRGIRVVKSFAREEYETQKFEKVSEVIRKDFSKAEKMVSLSNPVMQMGMYACILILSYIGAKLIGAGTGFQVGDLTSVFSYSTSILFSLSMITMVYVLILMSKTSAKRIVEVIHEKADIESPENAITEVKNGSIKFENVYFGYSKDSKNMCLKNINLQINEGEVIGIIGGTGSSKSTLVQLIPRLYDVVEGAVYVGDVDVREYDLTALRDSVSFVLQSNELFLGTIKDNLKWGNENATDEEIVEACKIAQAEDFINAFPDGYDTMIDQSGRNVSGGQKQRLCIARALLKKPKIIVLDDSTSAVDTRTDKLIRESFKKYIPTTTKIIIAQRIMSVQDADKIIVMDNGKIDAVGTHTELLNSNKIYQEVYYSQKMGGEQNG